ncbi:MAG TPA: polymer-forming cytoskeletal protein [Desulfobulbus sp.]|nr:polymer-forming cytoskeletal protein [Desulfobulbus sp.]
MPISSIISSEMQVQGDIRFKGKARIDGTVQGDIRGEYLVISESGTIHGNLDLETLVCHGRVEGDVKAELITAHSTASINGCLTAANLTVEAGATLEGEIRAARREQAAAPLAAASAGTKGGTNPKAAPAASPETTA